MRFATYRFASDEVLHQFRSIEQNHGKWARFGDDVFVYAANKKWNTLTSRLKRWDRDARQASGSVSKYDLHMVVQKGRTFQHEHPDVPVILDKGRYLVVQLAKSKAARLAGRTDPCYHIEPLKENSVVFETVPRESVIRIPDASVAYIVAALKPSVFQATMAHLVSYPTRFSTSADYASAAGWAIRTLAGFGYETAGESVSLDGMGRTSNVVAKKTGTGGAGRGTVLIVGHLDSINYPGGVNAPAPGADDNASGSAGVVTMASVLAAHQFEHDLTFILFGGEEQGLYGSKQYVTGLSDEYRDRVIAVLNMDMIGTRNTSPPTVLLEGAPISQALINCLSSAAATYTSLNIQTSLHPYASDHVPFIAADIPAVLTIEGADDANDAIHTGNDTLDRVDAAYALEILRMNIGFVAEQAVLVGKPISACGSSGPADLKPETLEAIRVLMSHYQNLFAQYARLERDGRINDMDYANLQAARSVYDMFAKLETMHPADKLRTR